VAVHRLTHPKFIIPEALISLLPKADINTIASRGFPQHHQHCDDPRHPRPQQPQPFTPDRAWNNSYPYPDTMSLSYESRSSFMPESNYPQMQILQDNPEHEDMHQEQHTRYPSPPPPLSENPYHPSHLNAGADDGMDVPNLPTHETDAPSSPGRSKPIPKPDREVTKGPNGRFVCAYENCTEDVREFGRKVSRHQRVIRAFSH
jgi:hypothetical protein